MRTLAQETTAFNEDGTPIETTVTFSSGERRTSHVTPYIDGVATVLDPDGGVQAAPLFSISIADLTPPEA